MIVPPIRPAGVADADAIAALHAASCVHPERRSAGLGRRLLGAAMQQVAGRGEARAYLWVFDGNTRAIEFYRRLGGEIVEQGFEEIDGLKIPQSRIAWHDTLRLAQACA